ncbi:MAG TPA: hypothetical protein VFA70_01655 [Dehalococcoidia bacterium]|jgi:hypothetical protein|nr:hypothetical protein [Dehalococcoidia bacterium]
METFYCVGCRTSYPIEKAARLIPAAHRDGEAAGFCFVCVRESGSIQQPSAIVADPAEEAASA